MCDIFISWFSKRSTSVNLLMPASVEYAASAVQITIHHIVQDCSVIV